MSASLLTIADQIEQTISKILAGESCEDSVRQTAASISSDGSTADKLSTETQGMAAAVGSAVAFGLFASEFAISAAVVAAASFITYKGMKDVVVSTGFGNPDLDSSRKTH